MEVIESAKLAVLNIRLTVSIDSSRPMVVKRIRTSLFYCPMKVLQSLRRGLSINPCVEMARERTLS